jgi:hypothetical protein
MIQPVFVHSLTFTCFDQVDVYFMKTPEIEPGHSNTALSTDEANTGACQTSELIWKHKKIEVLQGETGATIIFSFVVVPVDLYSGFSLPLPGRALFE